ncbi:HAMP domain-containing sensor histidine kinase [Hymenobacter glacieicola]|uniref:histidine kinase n=1 Tax=Hymenobacter glacieicola TaxID=1562124 RepID=A0ABQ1WH04_9BACT|nr:ATP-binding protein [Hymenobacter glacieicola]GGG29174.1 PAS domain-containing sensor histidine kinase [Hymenobacter glacieicola]
MNLKTKITLALLTMLLLLLGVSAFTLYSLNRLDRSARNVLQDNLYSVELGQQMLRALDRLQAQEAPLDTQAKHRFEQLLAREAGNVTEPGEQQVVDSLFSELTATERYLASDTTAPQLWNAHMGQLRQLTYRMVNLNTQALTRKNEAANRLATEQSGYVLALLTFAVLTCLLFVLSVPEAAVSGLRKLSASIENATHQDYSNSIPVESHDEFGGVARAFNRLLVQLQDYRTSTLAQLLAERNRMVSLVNNLDEGLLLVDENRRLILANPVAQQLLALPPEQLLNRPAEEIAQQNDLFRELLRHLDTPAAQRPTEAAPVLTLAQHDEEAYYRVSVNDVVSFNEALDKMEFVGSILTLRNVSEYKKLDQAKSNFLATVSHELKTPLSSINFSLKLLQNGKVGPVNEEQQNILVTIKQENQRLLRLVGELIDVSRLESGNIQLNFQAARVTEVVQFAAATIQLQLQPKQLTLDLQVADTLPPVRADIEKTTWVLLNLLANAIRYSPEQAQIHIRAALTAEAQPQVCISVQDHGPGIAPQYQEKIFQRFVQIPNQSGYKGGSGLGLSIAREFIGSQGGQLWVESELGSGSTFSFTLPLARPD